MIKENRVLFEINVPGDFNCQPNQIVVNKLKIKKTGQEVAVSPN